MNLRTVLKDQDTKEAAARTIFRRPFAESGSCTTVVVLGHVPLLLSGSPHE